MTLEELQAFVRTAESGGVSSAARGLGMRKSNVSRLISALESKLDVRLLQRSTRGSVVTEEGRAFLDHARRILNEVEAAEASVALGEQTPRGILRVTTPHTFGARFLAPLLPRFFVRAPEVRLELQMTSRQVDLVDEGVDLALRIGSPNSSSLIMRRLAPNPILLCASPSYLRGKGTPGAPSKLAEHDLLLLTRSSTEVRLVMSQGSDQARPIITPKLTSNDPAVLVEAAIAGMGIAEVPLIITREFLKTGVLVELLADWQLPETEICALFHAGRSMAPRVRAFLDFLVDSLAPLLRDAVADDATAVK